MKRMTLPNILNPVFAPSITSSHGTSLPFTTQRDVPENDISFSTLSSYGCATGILSVTGTGIDTTSDTGDSVLPTCANPTCTVRSNRNDTKNVDMIVYFIRKL
jgi:hypothetical protein